MSDVTNKAKNVNDVPNEQEMSDMADSVADASRKVQELMQECETGRALISASNGMAQSDEMMNLLASIDNTTNNKYAFTLGRYLGEFMQKDPEKGLQKYAKYLKTLIEDPKYQAMKDYYSDIMQKAVALDTSPKYRTFVDANTAFQEDNSEEAQKIKSAIMDFMAAQQQAE